MADSKDIQREWIGRLVRVLLVFRGLVLLVTVASLPLEHRSPVVSVAVLAAVVASYVPLRHWDRIAPTLTRHPAYLALEVLLAMLILAAAGAHSSFFYFTLGTAALAGVVYGRRGAIPFSALLIALYELVALEGFPTLHPLHDVESVVFAPLLYPVALAAGIAAREMVERGVHTEMLLHERTEALGAERERLRVARELHDSLAKTVEGLAMTASVLPARCEKNPARAAETARTLAEDARQAAIEARALMSDLRPDAEELPLAEAIQARTQGFADRFGVSVSCECAASTSEPSRETKHELLRILGEALANAARHGQAANVAVSFVQEGEAQVLRVSDDGIGLSGPVDYEALKAGGHYGMAGMYERARAISASLDVEGAPGAGTAVTVRVPLAGWAAGTSDGLDGNRPSRRYSSALRALRLRRDGAARSARIRA
ncbi:MAG: sensor histidine kinase [Solirubrobacteraceae bacterium]